MFMKRPIIALLENDSKRSGLSRADILQQLEISCTKFPKWGLAKEMASWGDTGMVPPTAQEIFDTLFSLNEPIEYNRLSPFQNQTLLLIAERTLARDQKPAFVPACLILQRKLPPPPKGGFHLYISPHNLGAAELIAEVMKAQPQMAEMLTTSDASRLCDCRHALLYLTARTWTSGEQTTEAFERDVRAAMQLGTHLISANEVRTVCEDDRYRQEDAVADFADFLLKTPQGLVEDGIYDEISVPLKCGPYREVSMGLLAQALTEVPEQPTVDEPEGEAPGPDGASTGAAEGPAEGTSTSSGRRVKGGMKLPMWTLSGAHRATQQLALGTAH